MFGSMHIFSTTNQRSARNISRPSFPTSTGQLLRNACRKILAYAAPAHSKIGGSSRMQKGSKHTNGCACCRIAPVAFAEIVIGLPHLSGYTCRSEERRVGK